MLIGHNQPPNVEKWENLSDQFFLENRKKCFVRSTGQLIRLTHTSKGKKVRDVFNKE